MLGTKVELHVAHKLFWLRITTSMGEQLRVVLLRGEVEWIIENCRVCDWRIIQSWEDGFRDVDVLAGGVTGVHEGLALVQLHELSIWVPVVLA